MLFMGGMKMVKGTRQIVEGSNNPMVRMSPAEWGRKPLTTSFR